MLFRETHSAWARKGHLGEKVYVRVEYEQAGGVSAWPYVASAVVIHLCTGQRALGVVSASPVLPIKIRTEKHSLKQR